MSRDYHPELADLLHQKTGNALSIKQPWAWMIVHGHKHVENRGWSCRRLRGWIGIHASKSYDGDGDEWLRTEYIPQHRPDLVLPEPEDLEAMPRGGIVGRARVIDCLHIMATDDADDRYEHPLACGDYLFVLADNEPLPFRPCRGALKFFIPRFTA